jgi:phosphatidate cytidylyltransferase
LKYQREVTAAVLIPAVLLILVAAPLWAWALLVFAAALLALVEFYRLAEAVGWCVPRTAGIALFGTICAAAYFGSLAGLVAAGAAGLLLLPALVLFSSSAVPALLGSSAASVFATLYVSLGAGAIIALRAYGWEPVIYLLAIVWAGDSAAYYVGRKWGRRKLAPVISPKKTWEGLYGQLGAGLLVGALATAVIAFFGPPASMAAPSHERWSRLLFGAVLGLVVSACAVVGDLVESSFKRSCDVKESGGLLPGHGGFLDRLDSLLYASPVLLIVLRLFPGVVSR